MNIWILMKLIYGTVHNMNFNMVQYSAKVCRNFIKVFVEDVVAHRMCVGGGLKKLKQVISTFAISTLIGAI